MIVLASASPRRKELLSSIAGDFGVVPSESEEKSAYKAPRLYVQDLARNKAREVAARTGGRDTVIGADTAVYFKGRILGKPKDADEAKRFLSELSGKKHSVYTGVCIIKDERETTYYCKSVVQFNKLDEKFIDAYVAGGSPLDKAGAYGAQDEGVVRRVYGDFDNVVGLPLGRLAEILGE